LIYITGDMHGDLSRLDAAGRKLKKDDVLLVCGDFGFLWEGGENEKKRLKKLEKKKFTIAFIDGVHENYDLLLKYPEEEWKGGKVHRLGKNIFHLERGEIFTLEGNTFFAFGGGENEEKPLYQESGHWWEEEMPSLEEMEKGASRLKENGMQVDYILTHTPAPGMGLQNRARGEEAAQLYSFFTAIAKQVEYKKWFFGCIHLDRKITARHYALFEEILPLED
jgi:hypothetical protein